MKSAGVRKRAEKGAFKRRGSPSDEMSLESLPLIDDPFDVAIIQTRIPTRGIVRDNEN